MKSWQVAELGKPLVCNEGPTPEPTGEQVRVAVEACGVCHSDVHLWEGFFDLGGGNKVDLGGRPLPCTLGHEIVGRVEAVGPEARGASVGERRVVYPWIGCGACVVCASGEEQNCPRSPALGVALPGGYADHVLVPNARYLFDPGDLPAPLAATYACSGITAYSALDKLREHAAGRSLLLVGAGGVGLAGLSIAREILDCEIVVADIDPAKLEVAREAGADHVLDPNDADAGRRLRDTTGGGPAAAVDFVGADSSASFAFHGLARGGKLVIVGLFGGAMTLPVPFFPLKFVTVQGSYVGSPAQMAALMELARAGRVRPIPVETRPMDELSRTLAELRDGRIVGRVAVTP